MIEIGSSVSLRRRLLEVEDTHKFDFGLKGFGVVLSMFVKELG
jgi:hypothetical protein